MASVPVGIVATISIDYGSSSLSTETDDFQPVLTWSFGLDSLSAAVDVASKATNSASYFAVTMTHYGGGTDATTRSQQRPSRPRMRRARRSTRSAQQGDAQAVHQIYVEYGTGGNRGFGRLQRTGRRP